MSEMLFDLETDPYERSNLAADPAFGDILNELRAQLPVLRAEALNPS